MVLLTPHLCVTVSIGECTSVLRDWADWWSPLNWEMPLSSENSVDSRTFEVCLQDDCRAAWDRCTACQKVNTSIRGSAAESEQLITAKHCVVLVEQ